MSSRPRELFLSNTSFFRGNRFLFVSRCHIVIPVFALLSFSGRLTSFVCPFKDPFSNIHTIHLQMYKTDDNDSHFRTIVLIRIGDLTTASHLANIYSMSYSRSSKSQPKTKASSKPAPQQLPPSLAHELLMMQFMGGGSLERNAKRMMEQQARDMAPVGGAHHSSHHSGHDDRRRKSKSANTGAPLPRGEAYRDGRGNMWWDENEAVEFRGLLTPTQHEQSQGWVSYDPFGSSSPLSTTFSASEFTQSPYTTSPPGTVYPSYAYPGVIPYASPAPTQCRGSHPSSGFEDSFSPAVAGYAPYAHGDTSMMKKKTGMNLRGRARALFGGR